MTAESPVKVYAGLNAPHDPRTQRRIIYQCPKCQCGMTEIWPLGSNKRVDEVPIPLTCDDCEDERLNRIRKAANLPMRKAS